MSSPPSRPRRFFVETWGCQMNELDSLRMAGQLMRQGILPTRDVNEADLVLLNSCSVREKAEQKVYSRLGEYRRLKRERPGMRIGLCGCVAQQVGERALERVAELDFVLGPARVGELVELLPRLDAGERVLATGFPAQRRYDLDAVSRTEEFKGMVTVVEGCDKRCTFCIVPTTRGAERCRPLAEIVAEVRHLLDYGFAEIELLGQTVNHWREPGGSADFADLLDRVAELPGLRRLRFVTSYPRDFTPAMVDRLRIHRNICDYLHLPVQSGSDRILKTMGRGYGVEDYRELVDRVRAARPSAALSTDVIVGFPGESERDFEATLELVARIRFSAVFAFCYSLRPGTAATRLPDRVPSAIAEERLQRLLALQNEIQGEINATLVGQVVDVLVTGWGKEPGTQVGRTGCNRIVHFAPGLAPQPLGAMLEMRITQSMAHSLRGEPLSSQAPASAATSVPSAARRFPGDRNLPILR